MNHPFLKLSPHDRRPVFYILFGLTLALLVFMNFQAYPLITPAAPYGIVSYELAGTVSQAQAILDSWDPAARLSAAFSLGFDYLFMLVYSTTLSLACAWAGTVLSGRRWPFASSGVLLAWGAWLAALFDAMENLALTVILFGSVVSPWPWLAWICAISKFGLIFIGMTYGILAWVVSWVGRRAPGM